MTYSANLISNTQTATDAKFRPQELFALARKEHLAETVSRLGLLEADERLSALMTLSHRPAVGPAVYPPVDPSQPGLVSSRY